ELAGIAVDAYINHHTGILDGTMRAALLDTSTRAREVLGSLKDFAAEHVYKSRDVVENELGGLNAVQGLLEAFMKLLVLSASDFSRLRASGEESRKALRDAPIEALLFSLLPP